MKVFYEVDPFNRLIVKRVKGKSAVKKFRQVIRGRFKTDNKNRLRYEVFKSSGIQIPQKIKFSGKYSLDKKHNLILTLHKWNNQIQGNRLRLRTKLISAKGDEVTFLLNSRMLREKRSSYTVKLHGLWHADKCNRLTFGVRKEMDKKYSLTLFNAWNINKNNEIVYTYGGDPQVVTLKGRWHIKDRYRLSYTLDKAVDSGFNFRTSLSQIAPRNKNTYIKFDVMIGVSKRKTVRRKIVFICKYKLNKGKNLILEVSPLKGAIALKLTKEILTKNAMVYMESFLKDRERYLGGGVAFRW
ncbi:hypothetical protein ACFL0P_06535 [Candidatus Omnitrophota bacterium]